MSPTRFLLGSLGFSLAVVAGTHLLGRLIDDPTAVGPERDRSPCADCVRDTWLFTPRTP